jgi:SpoVK/Ycf46/Vps4 family AAA+-type ATPase
MPASQLLNRWIGALEGGADHLTMHTGQTVELPFDVLVLFSTNLHPADLGDDAFLRRIRYKIEIPSPSAEDYTRILQRECLSHHVRFDAAALAHLVQRTSEQGRELRGCQPRDIVEAVVDAARYEGRSPELTPAAIDEACDTYFVALNAA